ncbi:MAG: UDP-N-acetylglucosamine diphosphorylase/glucosamine-1-phosphate N-acetyltransferase [Myxococcales bacterium]|nr:UDP-N-acetylglucosamine diphosphorylase/glucosamine-1-phosphate N-acetyltransferase [Myxococcales bacterium]
MPLTAVVLAAGLGTRMRSPLAKVLHPLLGRPMVGWIVQALQDLGADVVVVVHHHEDAVRAALAPWAVRFARQESPRGTGDAVGSALPHLPLSGPVIVTAGDTPLLTTASIRRLVEAHGGACTVAAFEAADPNGYGRMVPGVGVVEDAACTPEQRRIRIVNSGLYVFDAADLNARLPLLQPHPPKDELWLTDLVGPDSRVLADFSADEFLGVNDKAQLAEARQILRRRLNRAWAASGVDFADLDSVSVDVSVQLHPGAVLGPGVIVTGASTIHGEVGPYCVLHDTIIHQGATVNAGSVCSGAEVHPNAIVGPLARLRPGADIRAGAHVGNFCEVKNTIVREGAKANHLTYLGDADIGGGANIGAGTITCNYDGVRKHRTTIGAGAFIGSNTALVAPIVIGAGAIVGAGSTLTQDVPADAIAVERAATKLTLAGADRLRAVYRRRAPK